MKKILIVEDQMLARKYLCSCIEKSTECEVASALTRADAALQRCGEGHIDLVVMDICTENDSDGLDAAEAIKKYYPRIKIVMVTSMLEGRFLDRARKIGADSFWYKDISPERLIDVINRTMDGESVFPDKTPSVQLGLADSSEFTNKEIEVLRFVCDGLEYSEIAERMNISVRTVKYHVSNILSKTGYANKTRLAIAVTNKNFIIPSSPEKIQ